MNCPHCHKEIKEYRTSTQSNALWLFATHLSEWLNEHGKDQRLLLKPTYKIWWTKEAVMDNLWRPFQKALYGTESTRLLKKQEQITKIHETLMFNLGQEHEVEYISFPSKCLKHDQMCCTMCR